MGKLNKRTKKTYSFFIALWIAKSPTLSLHCLDKIIIALWMLLIIKQILPSVQFTEKFVTESNCLKSQVSGLFVVCTYQRTQSH